MKLNVSMKKWDTSTYLDPGKEDGHSNHVVELCLPEAKVVEVGILITVFKEWRKEVTDNNTTVQVEENSNVTKQNDDNIQDVPDAFEILHLMLLDLNYFLDGIVDDEDDEETFTSHDEMVHSRNVSDQFQGTEIERWNASSGWWVFEKKPVKRNNRALIEYSARE